MRGSRLLMLAGRRYSGGGGSSPVPSGLAYHWDGQNPSFYQNAAGTTPTVLDGSSLIRRVNNIGTAGGYWLSPSDAKRANFWTDGSAGMPCIHFGGIGDQFLPVIAAAACPQPVTIYLVKEKIAFGLVNPSVYYYSPSEGGSDGVYLWRNGTGNLIGYAGTGVNLRNPEVNTMEVLCMVHNGPSNQFTAYSNGVEIAFNPAGTNTFLPPTLGGLGDGSDYTMEWLGYEYKVYCGAAHSAGTVLSNSSALMVKWGIPFAP